MTSWSLSVCHNLITAANRYQCRSRAFLKQSWHPHFNLTEKGSTPSRSVRQNSAPNFIEIPGHKMYPILGDPLWSTFFFSCLHLARAQNERNTKRGQSVMRTRTPFYTTIPRTPHRHTSLYVRKVTSLRMLRFLEVQFSRVETLGALPVGIYRLESSYRIIAALWEPLVSVREPAFRHWVRNS